jgi:type IV secretion system protein TrbC
MTRPHRFSTFLFTLMTSMFTAAHAFAAPGFGGGLPWEGPMDTFTQSITGPVARWCIMIAIVASAIGIAFTDGGAIWRKALFVVLGGSIAFGVTSIVATLGGS